jgi:hypothetical protein
MGCFNVPYRHLAESGVAYFKVLYRHLTEAAVACFKIPPRPLAEAIVVYSDSLSGHFTEAT